MKTGTPRLYRRSIVLAAAGILAMMLTACTGAGGGYLPPDTVFNGRATFGFNFSCEDKGGINPPTGQLRIQLTYTDHSTNALLGSPFSIQGTADELDRALEAMFCIGQDPPPGVNELIFVGTYRPTTPGSSPPASGRSPTPSPSTTR